MDKPMISAVDLDHVTFTCPCGGSVRGDGDSRVMEFLREHLPHTNGKVDETITDDGMRCLSPDTPRRRTYDAPGSWRD